MTMGGSALTCELAAAAPENQIVALAIGHSTCAVAVAATVKDRQPRNMMDREVFLVAPRSILVQLAAHAAKIEVSAAKRPAQADVERDLAGIHVKVERHVL